MKTYSLLYDSTCIAEIQIDDTDQARTAIKEMVEFWAQWEDRLYRFEEDYTLCWLNQVACALLNGRRGVEGEGWAPLDGSMGLKLLGCWPPEWDDDLITVEETT